MSGRFRRNVHDPDALRKLMERWLVRETFVAAAYFLAAYVAVRLTQGDTSVARIWPANAIAAATLVRLERVRWRSAFVLLAVAGFAAQIASRGSVWPTAAAHAGPRLLGVAAMIAALGTANRFGFPKVSIVRASVAAALFGIVAPGLAALAGALLRPPSAAAPLGRLVVDLWSSDAVGACLFAPPILLFDADSLRRLMRPRYLAANLATLVATLVAVYLLFEYARYPFVAIGMCLVLVAFSLGGFGTAWLTMCCGLMVCALWALHGRPAGLQLSATALAFAGLPAVTIFVTVLPPIAVGLGTDERRSIARDLRMSERRFRESMEHSPIGMLIANLEGVWVYANEALQSMLGYTQEELRAMPFGGPADPLERKDSEARRRRLLSGEIRSYHVERRFRHKNGAWVWTHAAVSLVRDDRGDPSHLVVQIESIDERKQAEARFAEERQRLEVTLAAIADAVITVDPQLRITYLNAAACGLLALDPGAAIGRRFDEIVHLSDVATGKRAANLAGQSLVHGAARHREAPVLLHRADGGLSHVLDTVSPVINAEGAVVGIVIALRDATRDLQRSQDLNFRATHDPLTRLANRTLFEERLRESFRRAAHLGGPAALVTIDLDRFKAVNDSGGHAAGDAVLRRVAEVVRSATRATDTVARLGGDEFAVILPDCSAESAESIARTLAAALNPLSIDWEGSTHSIGASVGVAMRSADMRAERDWLATADQACYAAKREGRGRVRFATATTFAE